MSLHNYQWLVLIEGFEYAWYSDRAPAANPTGTDNFHIRSRAVQDVAVASPEVLDPQVGVASGGSYQVRLAVQSTTQDLLRIGTRGASQVWTLETDLAQAPAVVTVRVNEAIPASVPAVGFIHIGQEALRYTGKVAGPVGQFTGCARARLDSRLRSHTIRTLDKGGAPKVTLEAVTWFGRGARVYFADVPQGATIGAADWVEACRGYLRDAPQLDPDGLSISLVVTPWTSALGRTVGGPLDETRLQHGWHAFDGVSAGHFAGLSQVWKAGAAFDSPTVTMTAAGSATINNWPWYRHKGIFDVTSPDLNRRGPIVDSRTHDTAYYLDPVVAVAYQPAGNAGTDGASGAFVTLDPAIHPAGTLATIQKGAHLRNGFARIYVTADLVNTPGGAVIPWPDGPGSFNDLLNTALDITDPYGSTLWAWQTVQRQAEESGWVLTARLRTDAEPTGVLQIRLQVPSSRVSLWYGLQLCPPDGSSVPDRTENLTGGRSNGTNWESYAVECNTTINTAITKRDEYPVRGYADAFYQTGETWIHAEDDISGGLADFPITIGFIDADGTERRLSTTVKAVKTAASVTAGTPGYLYEVDAPWILRAFGDWPGQDRAVIRWAARWQNQPPTAILLGLLLSSEGRGLHTYDGLPWGVGLTPDDVDVPSFLRFPLPSGAAGLVEDFTILDETTVEALVGSILRLIGAALVVRLDQTTRRRKLVLVRVGLPSPFDVSESLADGQWLVDGRPVVEVAQNIENVLELSTTQDYLTGNPLVDVRLVDIAGVAENDGRTEIYSDSAPWLTLIVGAPDDARAALVPVAIERWSLFGSPRILLRGRVPADLVETWSVGQVVRVDASNVRLYDGSRGLSGGLCLVVEIGQDRWRMSCEVVLLWYGSTRVTGYAPAMNATAVAGAASLTVAANAFTDAAHPVTGAVQTDAEYFRAGDLVRLVPPDFAASVIRTILSVVGNTVTFTAAHGFAAIPTGGLTVRPDAFGNNPTTLDPYAFQAGAAGTLAGGVAGYQYA